MKKWWMIIFILGSFRALGQDVQYSQFYAAPMYLNPAFAGSAELTRVGLNYRNQWPGLDHTFNSYSAYIDHYMFDINSGIGLQFNGSQESRSSLSTMEVGLVYSYRLQLGFNNFLRFGGQASYVSRDAYFGDVVLGTQMDISRGIITDRYEGQLAVDSRRQFADFSFGMLFNNDHVWLGLAGFHLNQPNMSFLDDQISILPMKLSAHGGIRINLPEGGVNNYLNYSRQQRALLFAFNFRQQQPFNQLEVGSQLVLEPITLGVWYRGLPVKYSLPNNEAIIASFGFTFDTGFDIGYSFDFNTSRLGLRDSGGAHEVSLRYSFLYGNAKDRNRKSTVLPCFKF
ncbi:PorP/SprF family type IX secretion system membrane protein [Anditalea andensis]|uniref:Membrane protein n=1 Tax=Anditalea andensis TaxID=1048983 RepID=A0A074L6T0_9BACT|nr:type IX secretion system membrane protein PorP/SprF [Anditalea andensis]KEO75533.1 membrane protein [Anditalea andensis]